MVTRFERDRVIQAHILPRQSNLNSAWTRIYNTRYIYIYACIESNTKAAKPTARKAKAKNLENPVSFSKNSYIFTVVAATATTK